MQYSATALDHFSRPRNAGRLANADAEGKAGTVGQGNYMVLFLRIHGGRVTGASFETFGCPSAIASGSVTTELVEGKSLAEAAAIDSHAILEALDGLPLGRQHCAGLAAEALSRALASYRGS